MNNPKTFLRHCFDEFVDASSSDNILPRYLPNDRNGNAIVIGAGKAAASMAATFEKRWKGGVIGIVVTPYGHSAPCKSIKVIEASHPTPDTESVTAAKEVVSLVKNLENDIEVFVLLSGGGSSLLCLPPDDISLSEKQQITRSLLKSGADINEINCVRKHLSLIKGGRLASMLAERSVRTYAISDVVGDDPAVIASGPTVADPSTSIEALSILDKYSIDYSNSVARWLESTASETIKQVNQKHSYQIIASAKTALKQLGEYCLNEGVHFINLGELMGDATLLAQEHALIAKQTNCDVPTLIYSGGETTVEVTGNGKGGRNTQYLLSLAIALKGAENIYAIAADSDGIDGNGDHAGAIITPNTLNRLKEAGFDAEKLLNDNDSYKAFATIDDLIITGPTRTNVNDLRAILILPSV